MDDDWQLDEGLDPEGPSADDLDRFGDELNPCPNCGAEVYDQADICPACGEVLHTTKPVSAWVGVVVVVLVIVIALFWVL